MILLDDYIITILCILRLYYDIILLHYNIILLSYQHIIIRIVSYYYAIS